MSMIEPAIRVSVMQLKYQISRIKLLISLGYLDHRLISRKTKLGAFWPVIYVYAIALAISSVFSILLGKSDDDYSLNIVVGWVYWSYFVSVVNDSSITLLRHKHVLTGSLVNDQHFFYRDFVRSSIVFVQCVLILPVFMRIYGHVSYADIWGLFLVTLVALLLGFSLGLFVFNLSKVIDNLNQYLALVVQGVFFITPIVWTNNPIIEKFSILKLNPLNQFYIFSRGIIFDKLFNEAIFYIFSWSLLLVFFSFFIKTFSPWKDARYK